jgi:integrase
MSDSFTSLPVNDLAEGIHESTGRILSVGKKRRKKRARSMGRYPLRTAIGKYMESNRDYLAGTTYAERDRKLRMIARRWEKICEGNPSLRRDPEDWTERELTAFILDMRQRGLSLGTQKKTLGHVQAVLKFVGNPVLIRMKAQMPHAIPRGQYVKGPSLNEDQVAKILTATESMKGYRGEVARFVMATYAYTGLRLSELRRARFEDLDTKTWVLRVRHPKGEGSYGDFRTVPIPGPLRPRVERFLRARERMIAEKDELTAEPLIPRQRGGPDAYYSEGAFERVSARVRDASGVDFQFRTLRRTYGQSLLDRGVGLPSVSLMLGHNSTLTTEKYYCRQDADSARAEVLKAFESVVRPVRETSKLTPKTELTGYV